jgi:hypothetical protein
MSNTSSSPVIAGDPASDNDPVQGYSPAGQLMHLISGYWVSQAIFVAAELGIADLLGRNPRSVEDLADQTGAHAASLYRVLRALASVGIFTEPAPRRFALTAMGALLKSDMPGNLRAFSRFQGEAWHWGCWGDIVQGVRSGEPVLRRRENVEHCFEYFARHSRSERLFADAMSGYAAHAQAAVVDAYDFSAAKLIVDVGGGQGTLLAAVLADAPQARGVLLDLPEVVARAETSFESYGVADRCSSVAGDFFRDVPQNADCYLLSAVVHDWNDEDAGAILRCVAAAMPSHGKVLLVENVITAGDEPHVGKFIDLEMMLIATGRERTESEYRSLLAAAGLEIIRIVPTAASCSIIEAERARSFASAF